MDLFYEGQRQRHPKTTANLEADSRGRTGSSPIAGRVGGGLIFGVWVLSCIVRMFFFIQSEEKESVCLKK